LDLLGHFDGPRLNRGPEGFLHEHLPQGLAEIAVHVLDAAFPARLQLVDATQSLAVECKILVDETRRKIWRFGMRQMPAHIRLPVGETLRRQLALYFLVKFGL